MSYRQDVIKDGVLVAFAETVDPEDSAGLKEIFRKPAHRRMVVDLTLVPVITTPGLGLLVSLHKVALEEKKALVLVGLSPYLKEIFDLTRLSGIFTILESREEAIGA